jgi:predicted naringenin-chalcone synthase
MVAIRSIETAVPAPVVVQSELRDVLAGTGVFGRLGRRLVTAAFDASAIDTRHTVLDELVPSAENPHPAYLEPAERAPGTGARNDVYVASAGPLAVDAAARALGSEGARDLDPGDVTHVITASCTGFSAPGVDLAVVRGLGLSPSTQRYHLGFLGCYAAFPALRMAEQFCRADPSAVVLVVCVELCSLHLHVEDDPDTIVAASVFADGAAAAVVTARPAPEGTPVLDLDAFRSTVITEGADEMAWTIGDHGFDMVLSSYVPRIIGQSVGEFVQPLLGSTRPADVDAWAIHPGGRSILDRVQTALELSDEQLAPSRGVLREFGNMSSATVLFILRRILHDAPGPGVTRHVAALAFGPGLTVESARLTLRREKAPASPSHRPSAHRRPVPHPAA